MRVYATEICDPADSGVGWGIKIVTDGLAACGVPVEVVPILDPTPRPLPDVWLLSMPFAGNAAQLAGFFAWAGIEMDAAKRRRAPFILMGGHAVVNVEPFLDVADAVFVGEADDQIPALAAALTGGDLDALSLVPGVCMDRTSEVWFQVASSLERRGFYGAAMGEAGSGVGETTPGSRWTPTCPWGWTSPRTPGALRRGPRTCPDAANPSPESIHPLGASHRQDGWIGGGGW